jgi:hypothetical protein
MSIDSSAELTNFHRFISERIVSGDTDLSPEEALDLWRAENPASHEQGETVAAVREALAAYQAGDRGVPLAQFDREFRERHNLGPACPSSRSES